jgi:NADPH2:quinone reductase
LRAVRQYEFGPPSVLRLEDVPDPVPAEGFALVRVEASGVHFIDTVIRRGIQMGPMPLPSLPMTPGREVAGVVSGGEWDGRRVVAHLGPASGGYAELAAAPVAALHERPSGLSADLAVAMIGTGRTAMSILSTAAITAQDTVLVTAAAGGLGTLFVQAALHAGATVVGAAGGPRKVARVGAGAPATPPRLFAVDYLASDFADQVRAAVDSVSVVLDGVGGEVRRTAVELLRPGGRLVHYGWSSGDRTPLDEATLAARGVDAVFALGLPADQRALETAALQQAAAGRLVPALQRFALADAATAHAAIEARETVGKVVLIP